MVSLESEVPKDGLPLARRRSEPLSDHSGKGVRQEKDDSFEMPCACGRWRVRWVRRERGRRVKCPISFMRVDCRRKGGGFS